MLWVCFLRRKGHWAEVVRDIASELGTQTLNARLGLRLG